MSETQYERDQDRKDRLRSEAKSIRIQALAFARDIHRIGLTLNSDSSQEKVAAETIQLAEMYESFISDGTMPDIEAVSE